MLLSQSRLIGLQTIFNVLKYVGMFVNKCIRCILNLHELYFLELVDTFPLQMFDMIQAEGTAIPEQIHVLQHRLEAFGGFHRLNE